MILRCKKCGRILAEYDLKFGYIEVSCKHCKETTKVEKEEEEMKIEELKKVFSI